MKKWLAISLLLVALLALSACESADENFVFEESGDHYAVVGYDGTTEETTIPSSYEGQPVTSIKRLDAIMGKLKIPDSISVVEDGAFDGAIIGEVEFAGNLDYLGARAFADCVSLKKINIPSGIVTIGEETFTKCSGLETVELPIGLVGIDEHAFSWCGSLASIKLPDTVEYIGDHAFRNTGFSQIELPGSLQSIGDNAFNYCYDLESISLPGSLTYIGRLAFQDSGLKSIAIPDSVKFIGDFAFSICGSLSEINLPDNLEILSSHIFAGAHSLKAIDLPENLKEIRAGAFSSCDSLRSIVLPGGLETIGYQAFYGCESLTEMEIPEGVKSIGERAFEKCGGLRYMSILGMDTELGEHVFTQISDIVLIVRRGSTAENYALENGIAYVACDSVDEIRGLQGADLIFTDGDYSYVEHDNQLTIVNYTGREAAPSIPSQVGGVPVTRIGAFSFAYNDNIKSLTIPEGIVMIGNEAFEHCHGLERVSLPASLEHLGISAFSSCYELNDVTFMEGLVRIGQYCFFSDDRLETVILPASLQVIESNVFALCSLLSSVSIPDGVTYIGHSAFSQCDKLNNVVWPSSTPVIERNMFTNCRELEYIHLPEGVTSIGIRAFDTCHALKEIVLPDGLKTIDESAFANAVRLQSITMPDSIVSIGENAFSNTWFELAFIASEGSYAYSYAVENSIDVLPAETRQISGYSTDQYMEGRIDPDNPIAQSRVSLSDGRLYMVPSQHQLMSAQVRHPTENDVEVYWESTNAEVAAVDSDGLVHAISPGVTSIIAYSSIEGNASSPCVVEVLEAPPRYRALLIANEEYTMQDKMRSPLTNAGIMKDILANVDYWGGRFETPVELYNATGAEMIAALENFADPSGRESDITLIYYNGHGSEQGLLGVNDALPALPGLTYGKLKSILDGMPGTVVLVLETCHSGSSITPDSSIFTLFFEDDGSGQFTSGKYKVLASSLRAQDSFEYPSNGNYYGVMMSALYSGAGRGEGDSGEYANADVNVDGAITLGEMAEYINQYTDEHFSDYFEVPTAIIWPEKSEFPLFRRIPYQP